MAISDRQLLDALSRMPVDSTELALTLGEPHATVHRALNDLLADGTVGRVSHGTAHLPSSQRYHLTANGIRHAAELLGYDTPSDFVRAYPMFRECLTLLIRRMDAVASVYRLAASLSPGIDGLRSRVDFHRRGRFDATITLHDGRSFGVVRQGLALRRRSLYDRLRTIAEYDYTRRPDTVLILVPSVWEKRLTTRFCEDRNIRDCYVAVESRDALERRDLRHWCCTSWVIGSSFFSLEGVISRSSPGGRIRTLSPRIMSLRHREEQLEAARDDAETQLEQRRVDLPNTEEIARYVAEFQDFLKDGTLPERKALIRNFVEGIEVMGDEATLTYTVPMPSDGVTSESASVLDFVKSGPPVRGRTGHACCGWAEPSLSGCSTRTTIIATRCHRRRRPHDRRAPGGRRH